MLNLRYILAVTLLLCAMLALANPNPVHMHEMQQRSPEELPKRQLKQLKLKRGDVLPRFDRPRPPRPSPSWRPYQPYQPYPYPPHHY